MDIITSDQLLGPAKFIHVHQGYLTGSWAIIWFTIVYIKQPYKTGKYMAWSYNHNKMYVKKIYAYFTRCIVFPLYCCHCISPLSPS